MTTPPDLWVSRLRPLASASTTDGVNTHELPHVRGMPVRSVAPPDATIVAEWPNLAGRLERCFDEDIVRWDRSLAPPPPVGRVQAYGPETNPTLLVEMLAWFRKFVRTLEQEPGLVAATPFDTPRAIILTRRGLPASTHHRGLDPVPDHLAEFPGGVIVTLRESTWTDRSLFADEALSVLTKGASL